MVKNFKDTNTCAHMCTDIHRHAQTHTHTQKYTCKHTCKHTHMHTPKHTQTHRETQTHIEYCTFNIVLNMYCIVLSQILCNFIMFLLLNSRIFCFVITKG